MADVYIARTGLDNQEPYDRFASTEIETVKDSLAHMEQEAKVKEERIQELERVICLTAKVPIIVEIMESHYPSTSQLQLAMRKRRSLASDPAS